MSLASPTSGGRPVGIVLSQTKATVFILYILMIEWDVIGRKLGSNLRDILDYNYALVFILLPQPLLSNFEILKFIPKYLSLGFCHVALCFVKLSLMA
jgi:hypothetical protein